MPPRMKTRSAGRPTAESLGGGTGERVGRGGRGRRHRESNDEHVDELNGQGNDQGIGANRGIEGANGNVEGANGVSNRGNVGNQNGNVVNEKVQENVRNAIVNGNWVGFSYKEFLACNPKEYYGKGGAAVLTRWIEEMESVHDMSGCSVDQKVKYTAGSFVGKALTWWNSQIRMLSQEVSISMSCNDFKYMMTQEFCPSYEMQKLESEFRMIERYVYGLALQIRRMVAATEPKTLQKVVQISGALTDEAVRNGSIKRVEKRGNVGEPSKDRSGKDDNKRTRIVNAFATTVNPDCRSVPRNVNLVNARNPTVRACYECGSTDHGCGNQGNQARGRAFMFVVEEARQDPNIMTGMFNLNDHFATAFFDSGADYSFVSTTFMPLLGLGPSDLGHVFDIDLIPFVHGSFDMIIGIDWLSNNKAEIICHEKVVRIPLPDGNVLRVLGERPDDKPRSLMSTRASDKTQEEIVVVKDFPEVFPDDLSGLLPIREIEFWIELIPGATPVAKSIYCLSPSELEELSGQLKEQDK
ncbi:putative reverse transcriptase domain-containing protein, partial [Tanacetum coccineum]